MVWDGVSKVEVTDVASVCEWLAGCEYVGDENLFREDDFWQHPLTFEQLRRGDCEDHALWAWRKLAELGFRVEFFSGEWIGDGSQAKGEHSWVVFHDSTGSYLLDPVIRDPGLVFDLSTVQRPGTSLTCLSISTTNARCMGAICVVWEAYGQPKNHLTASCSARGSSKRLPSSSGVLQKGFLHRV